MVYFMGRRYLQLEFLLTKTVWECAASFDYGFVFSHIIACRLIRCYLDTILLQSQPLVRFIPTLGCPHQKTNPWESYLCGISLSPSPYPGAKNIPWLSNNRMGSQMLLKINIRGGTDTGQRLWGDSSNSSSFLFQKPTTVMCWLSRKLGCYVRLCPASCIQCVYFKIIFSGSSRKERKCLSRNTQVSYIPARFRVACRS